MQHARLPCPFPARHACVLAALACQGAAAQPASAVQAFSGRYEGQQKVAILTATAVAAIELRRSSRFILYTMHTTVSAAFIKRRFLECSVMRIDGDRLLPVAYAHRDESSPEHGVLTRFDWAAGSAKTTFGGTQEPRTVTLEGPTWDPMSYQVALVALAHQRRPGDRERFRVIERGTLKEHDATFEGPAAVDGGNPPQYGIVSRKSKGLIALALLPQDAWRPARVTVDDVTIRLMPGPMPAPTALPEDGAPSCENMPFR